MIKKVRAPLALLFCLLFCICIHTAAYAREAEVPTAAARNDRLVAVTFSNNPLASFSALTVYDNAGQLCAPHMDTAAGEIVYGSYRLSPGQYRYHFHDETGAYEDLDGEFSVSGDSDRQFVAIYPVPHLDIEILSTSYINPAYIDDLTEAELPVSPRSDEELIDEVRQLYAIVNGSLNSGRLRSTSTVSSINAAGLELRRQMLAFEAEIVIKLQLADDPEEAAKYSSISDYREARWDAMEPNIYLTAVKHTGIPTQGDYLRYECGGYTGKGAIAGTSGSDLCVYTFYYYPYYYSSAEQEADVDAKVNSILAELSLTGKSDYEKIQAIFQYLTEHVKYGGSAPLKYTAYAALVDNLAVCQGYSVAFYRLCLEAGVDARIIKSIAMKHAWNIVRFRGQYYELDSTWDAGYSSESYRFFLRGRNYWLSNHTYGSMSTLGDEFDDAEFAARYVLPVYDFADVQAAVVYKSASLQGRISKLEDRIGTMAQSLGSTALGLDEIRVQFTYRTNADGTTDESVSCDLYPSVSGYLEGKQVKSYRIGNADLLEGPAFVVTLPVPDSWAGKKVNYTISASGYEDVSASADVVRSSSGKYLVPLSNITFFGSINISLVKYTLSFDSMGGSAVEAQSVIHGSKASEPVSPVKADFWFGGWYKDKTCSEAFDFANTPITADTILYARWIVPDLVLPEALTAIEEEAFAGGAFSFVKLPEEAQTIGSRAFADCPNLACIYIPASVRSIDASSFGDASKLTVYGKAESAAESFAKSHGFTFIAVS